MTNEKIIEEMAKVLHDRIINKTWRAKKVAKELYNIAVPEGSVVISEEEWADNISIDVFIEKVKKTVKETAREIIELIDKSPIPIKSHLKQEIAKQYGVEVE